MLNPEKMTIKSREALQTAHELAVRLGHPELRPLHLLAALCEQSGGIVAPLLQRLGTDPRAIAAAAGERLSAAARVEGAQDVRISSSLDEILKSAGEITKTIHTRSPQATPLHFGCRLVDLKEDTLLFSKLSHRRLAARVWSPTTTPC